MKLRVLKFMKIEIGRRMSNWSMAKYSGMSIRSAMSGFDDVCGFDLAGSSGVYEGSRIPILFGEAEETDKVLARLHEPQQKALVLQHVKCPPVDQRHREMGLTNGAYYRLVDSAHHDFFHQLKTFQNKQR